MAYQACYDCEMVYEVHAENSLCPQCNRPLVPYDYEPEVEAPAEVPPDPAPADTAEPPATVALDVSSLPPMPDLEPVAPPGGVRKSTLLGPPKPVAQPFTGDALGGIDLHNDPVTGNTDPMPAPNIPRPEESGPADLPRTMALSAGDLPDLGPLGVSSAQVPEPSPPAELPRTVALSADQLGDLPPMGEGSAPPPQQAEGERRTKAINLNDLGDVAAGLTPPGPAVAPPVEVPVIAERAAVPTGSTERQMANLGSIQPRRRKGNKKSKVGLIVGLSLLLLAGIGVALYFFVFADSGKKTVEGAPAAAARAAIVGRAIGDPGQRWPSSPAHGQGGRSPDRGRLCGWRSRRAVHELGADHWHHVDQTPRRPNQEGRQRYMAPSVASRVGSTRIE